MLATSDPSSSPPPPHPASRPARVERGDRHGQSSGSTWARPCRTGPVGSLRAAEDALSLRRPDRRPGGQTAAVRVLVVEDEVHLAETVKRGLQAEGFDVELVHDGGEGLWRARERPYAAVVLDILLPGMNGYEVCRTLREAGVWTPVLMLTAKNGEYDEAEALDIGRRRLPVQAVLVRGPGGPPAGPGPAGGGPPARDPHRRRPGARPGRRGRATGAMTPWPSRPRELALLAALLRRPGEVVPKRDLLRRGVGRRLRRRRRTWSRCTWATCAARSTRPFGRRSLQTVRGAGYRVTADA